MAALTYPSGLPAHNTRLGGDLGSPGETMLSRRLLQIAGVAAGAAAAPPPISSREEEMAGRPEGRVLP